MSETKERPRACDVELRVVRIGGAFATWVAMDDPELEALQRQEAILRAARTW